MDSDTYKTVEAVSYSLATDPDRRWRDASTRSSRRSPRRRCRTATLDTWFQVNSADRRWTNPCATTTKLYCAGHLFEAAVAHYYQATGKGGTLLNVAVKLADHIAARFGDGPGQRMGYPGHRRSSRRW